MAKPRGKAGFRGPRGFAISGMVGGWEDTVNGFWRVPSRGMVKVGLMQRRSKDEMSRRTAQLLSILEGTLAVVILSEHAELFWLIPRVKSRGS